MSAKPLGNLVRTVPLELSDLPPHSSIPKDTQTDSSPQSSDSRLLTFLLSILEEGSDFLSPTTFTTTFKSLSTKPSSPSTSDVEVYKREIPASELSSIPWSKNQKIPRKTPATFPDENWFARRSVHENVSSKQKEGSASWNEFVFGLKEQHSKHEQEFTPTLYDAHYVLDWNEEIKQLQQAGQDWIEDEHGNRYIDITMEIYEMCHSLPGPLSPRCFPILVLTAYTTPTSFLAVTVPVNLSSAAAPLQAAYYSTGANTTDPKASDQQRKKPVLGVYAAVETVRILGNGGAGEGEGKGGKIEWTMATASDTKGNLPMFVQKPNLPGAVAKDVGFFMGWIRGVDVEKDRTQKEGL